MTPSIDERYIDTVGGARLRCLSAGRGRNTIVLIPGITMAAEVFAGQMERFASDRVRVVSFDPRGQGDSTKDWNHHDYDTRANDVDRVIQAFADDPVVLGSWSQGLFEHLSFVRRYGVERTAAAIIIDSAPRQVCEDASREWGWLDNNPSSPPELHVDWWIVCPSADRAVFNRELFTWMLEEPTSEALEYFEAMCSKTPDGITSLLSALAIPLDFREEVKALARSQPTQVVVRQEWEAAAGRWISEHAPQARFATMPKHASFWERPEWFNDLVADFLNRSLDWDV